MNSPELSYEQQGAFVPSIAPYTNLKLNENLKNIPSNYLRFCKNNAKCM